MLLGVARNELAMGYHFNRGDGPDRCGAVFYLRARSPAGNRIAFVA